MIQTLQGEKFAVFKTLMHIMAAFVIVWYIYRVSRGQFSLL